MDDTLLEISCQSIQALAIIVTKFVDKHKFPPKLRILMAYIMTYNDLYKLTSLY